MRLSGKAEDSLIQILPAYPIFEIKAELVKVKVVMKGVAFAIPKGKLN
jgi:hypothetical protein